MGEEVPPDKGGTVMEIGTTSQDNANEDSASKNNTENLRNIAKEKSKVFNLQKPNLYSEFVYVFIEKINDQNIGKLHPMAVGHILHKKLNISNILKIDRVGKNRIRVQLKTIKDANNLISNKELVNENLRAFIPNNLLFRKGLIKFIDTSFDEKYLFTNFLSPITILEVHRVHRKIESNGQTVFVPKQTVIVTFEGNKLPTNIFINSVSCPVEPYVYRVTQCFRCLKYGHVAKQCRSTISLCINCGKEKIETHTCRDPQDNCCIYCKTNTHKSISRDCPTYKKQMEIKKKMAYENLSFMEAKVLNNASYANAIQINNKFQILNQLTEKDFPALPPTRTSARELPKKPSQSQIKYSTDDNKPQNQSSSQHESTKKKRKASSPPAEASNQSMFPFRFGPEIPISFPSKEYVNCESEEVFINNFFAIFQKILCEVKSFEELANIDIGFIKKIAFTQSRNTYEDDPDEF